MKPTTDQERWLKNDLRRTLKYKETHDEVYDHILLALKSEPEAGSFEAAVSNIVKYNFGGGYGLLKLEKDCIQSTAATANQQYWDVFKRWFLSPLIVVTLALFLLVFRLHQIKGAGLWVMLSYIALLVVPVLLSSLRSFALGYKYGKIGTSIRDVIIRNIIYRANRTLWTICILNNFYTWIRMWLFNYHPVSRPITSVINSSSYTDLAWIVISSASFTYLIIHILSVIELYRSEFELKVIS